MTENDEAVKVLAINREVIDEVFRITHLHGSFNSAHEAYAVLKEEMDEFWDEVKKKRQLRNKTAMRNELVQIAACAIKAIVSLGLGEKTVFDSQL